MKEASVTRLPGPIEDEEQVAAAIDRHQHHRLMGIDRRGFRL
jgi:hypothetical protein